MIGAGLRKPYLIGSALFWLGVFGLLFLVLRQVPLADIWPVLQRLRLGQMIALIGVNALILFIMTARWQIVLHAMGGKTNFLTLLSFRLAGFGVSYFTPGPQLGGEPVQVHLLHSKQGVALHAAASSVFLDRMVDLMVNFTFLALGMTTIVLFGFGSAGLEDTPWGLTAGLIVFPLAHLCALGMDRRPLSWIISKVTRLLARLAVPLGRIVTRAVEIIYRSEDEIVVLLRQRPLVFARLILLAGITWSVMVFEFWLCLNFLGVSAGLVETVVAMTAARVAFLMPLPAGLGALEASLMLAARIMGWDPAAGIALSLVIRARDLLLAVAGLWVSGAAYRGLLFRRI